MFLDGLLIASVARVFVRFRAKREEERERGVQTVGTGACFKKRIRGKRGEISSHLFFLVIFSPALLGSWLCIIVLLDSTEAPSMKVRCFLLFVFFVFLFVFFSCLLLVIVTFLRFVVSSSPIRITLECKQIVPFSPHPSPLSALLYSTLVIFHVTHHVTAFDQ